MAYGGEQYEATKSTQYYGKCTTALPEGNMPEKLWQEIYRTMGYGGRGHYAGEATARKIWRNGLWWPTTLKDLVRYMKECDLCQRMGQSTEQARIPHQPVLPLEPFQKWGLVFVGPFKPPAMRTGNRYVIVTTNYYTKWVEAKALRDNTMTLTTKFLYEYIWCRYGCLIELIRDQGGHFSVK